MMFQWFNHRRFISKNVLFDRCQRTVPFINVTLNVTSWKFSIEGRYIRVRTSLSLFLTSSNLQLDVKKYILENTVAAYTAYIYIYKYIYIYIYRERERERETERERKREGERGRVLQYLKRRSLYYKREKSHRSKLFKCYIEPINRKVFPIQKC